MTDRYSFYTGRRCGTCINYGECGCPHSAHLKEYASKYDIENLNILSIQMSVAASCGAYSLCPEMDQKYIMEKLKENL